MDLSLLCQVYCTLQATPLFSFSHIILGKHVTDMKCVENVYGTKLLCWI